MWHFLRAVPLLSDRLKFGILLNSIKLNDILLWEKSDNNMRHALPHFRYPTQLPPWYCVLRSSRYRGSVRDNVLVPLIPLAMGTGNIYTWCWVFKKRMKASKYLLPSQIYYGKSVTLNPEKIHLKGLKMVFLSRIGLELDKKCWKWTKKAKK